MAISYRPLTECDNVIGDVYLLFTLFFSLHPLHSRDSHCCSVNCSFVFIIALIQSTVPSPGGKTLQVSSSRAIPFGDSHFSPNFARIKRDEKLTYAQALCNGEKLYDMIQAVYRGTPSRGVTFTQQDLNNGWSRVTEHILPDEEWDGFFHEALDRIPGRNEVSKIAIHQDQFFTNSAGTRVVHPSTNNSN